MTEMTIEQVLNTLQFKELAAIHKHYGGGFDFNRGPTNFQGKWGKQTAIEYLMQRHPEQALRDIAFTVVQSGKQTEQTKSVQTNNQSEVVVTNDKAEAVKQLLEVLGVGGVDEVKLQQIVDAKIADAVKRLVKRIEVKIPEVEARDVGVQHKSFETLLLACNARMPDGHRLNVWLKGPAGSGKTTAAKMVSKALGLSFTFNGAIDSKYDLTGFIDASGRYNRTPFRDAWEHGGVYLFDEVDSSNPNAVLAFNAALANGMFCFPDGIVSRHPDCIVIAGANTSGNGASSEYNGRFKQDAAFLDRFVFMEWEVDETLESAISPNAAWTARVQAVRSRLNERGVRGHLVTPRASVYGASLLAAGIPEKQVEAMVLRKGLAEDVWSQVR